MPTQFASLIFTIGIAALFYFDFKGRERTSSALWIPAIYLFLIASRPASVWLGIGPVVSTEQAEDGSPVDRIVYLALQISALVVLINRSQKVSRLLRDAYPVTLFFSYCLVSVLWSDFPLVAAKRWIKMTGDVMMVLVVLTDPSPLKALKRFLSWPAYLLIPLSILFIKYFPELGKGYDQWTGVGYYHGASYNKNGLGAITLFFGVGYVWMLLISLGEGKRSWKSLLTPVVMIAMTLWLLGMSKSATSMSCFAMGTILLTATRIPFVAKRPFVMHALAIPMVLVPFAVLFMGQGSGALNVLQRDSTLTGRTELWSAILPMVENPLLGAGFESFWLGRRLEALWKIFWWAPTQAHNGYLEIYINLGWIGIALLTTLVLSAYLKALSFVRRGELAMGLGLAFTVIALPYNFTEATFRMQNLPWVFLLFAAIGLPKNSLQQPTQTGSIPESSQKGRLDWSTWLDEAAAAEGRTVKTGLWFT